MNNSSSEINNIGVACIAGVGLTLSVSLWLGLTSLFGGFQEIRGHQDSTNKPAITKPIKSLRLEQIPMAVDLVSANSTFQVKSDYQNSFDYSQNKYVPTQ